MSRNDIITFITGLVINSRRKDMGMSGQIMEFATIALKHEHNEVALLSASEEFQKAFLNEQPGFVRRDMVRKSDGVFVDVIVWRSQAEADAAFERAQSSQAVGAYFDLMEFDGEADQGVEHYPVLRSFSKLEAG